MLVWCQHRPTPPQWSWERLPSMILAQISAPTPNWGQPPSTVTRWLVFMTLVSMLSTSMGRMVRRLITWRRRVGGSAKITEPRSSCRIKMCAWCYLALNALLGKDSGSIQTVTHVPGVTDQSHVSAWNSQISALHQIHEPRCPQHHLDLCRGLLEAAAVSPCLSTLALPMGMVKSLDWASSDISKGTPYNSSFSRKTTATQTWLKQSCTGYI